MNVIIAGSRTITDYALICRAVRASGFTITGVISGGARGVDAMGEVWAKRHGVPLTRLPARWGVHGKRAGMIRNGLMAAQADALIAVWDGQSRGTQDMIDRAVRRGLPYFVMQPAEGSV